MLFNSVRLKDIKIKLLFIHLTHKIKLKTHYINLLRIPIYIYKENKKYILTIRK